MKVSHYICDRCKNQLDIDADKFYAPKLNISVLNCKDKDFREASVELCNDCLLNFKRAFVSWFGQGVCK